MSSENSTVTTDDAAPVVQRSTPRPGIAQLTLNRPQKLNAMTSELVQSLHDHLDEIEIDPSVRVVVLTGAGRGFCAGLDLGGYGTTPNTDRMGRTQTGFATQKHIARLIPHLRSLPQPVIAAVNGPAAGGGFALVLAATCVWPPDRRSSTLRSSASGCRPATSAPAGCCLA